MTVWSACGGTRGPAWQAVAGRPRRCLGSRGRASRAGRSPAPPRSGRGFLGHVVLGGSSRDRGPVPASPPWRVRRLAPAEPLLTFFPSAPSPPGQGPGDRGAAPLPPEAPCASLRRALAASGCLRGRPLLLWTFSCSFSQKATKPYAPQATRAPLPEGPVAVTRLLRPQKSLCLGLSRSRAWGVCRRNRVTPLGKRHPVHTRKASSDRRKT